MKFLFNIIILLGSLSFVYSQTKTEEREGTVTFVSSQYTYVKFENTEGINPGDTLYLKTKKGLKPVLQIEFISSTSSAGTLLNGEDFKVNDKLIALVESEIIQEIKEDTSTVVQNNIQPSGEVLTQKTINRKSFLKKSGIDGKFSIQSHTNFSNNPGSINYQRWRYTLSLDASRISNSNLSFSSYLNFNYRADNWSSIPDNVWQSLKVYDFAFQYEFNESTEIFLGRHRNRNISNVGAIDGLQFEKRFNTYYAGAVVGFRPDFTELNFNSDLLEYGGYVGRSDTLGDGVMDNNIAFMQQTNNGSTDRRFLYFQHSNNILKNTYFFVSSEVDLFKKILEVESNELILTSLFFSFRYSPARFFSATLSYDARKNVVYYETYKNFIDSLFENETRQGLNLRTTFRLVNSLYLGLNGGYRFTKGDLKTTRNYGGYLSYSGIPFIESSIAINYNRLISNYVESSVAGIRVSKNLFNNYVDLSLGYRRSMYDLTASDYSSSQNIFSTDISARFTKAFSFTISYEGVFEEAQTYSRVFAGIVTRF